MIPQKIISDLSSPQPFSETSTLGQLYSSHVWPKSRLKPADSESGSPCFHQDHSLHPRSPNGRSRQFGWNRPCIPMLWSYVNSTLWLWSVPKISWFWKCTRCWSRLCFQYTFSVCPVWIFYYLHFINFRCLGFEDCIKWFWVQYFSYILHHDNQVFIFLNSCSSFPNLKCREWLFL